MITAQQLNNTEIATNKIVIINVIKDKFIKFISRDFIFEHVLDADCYFLYILS